MLLRIDSLLLSKYQAIANWTDIRYGKNCYWWGYFICELLTGSCLLIAAVVTLTDEELIIKLLVGGFFLVSMFASYQRGRLRKKLIHMTTPVNLNSTPIKRLVDLWLVVTWAAMVLANPNIVALFFFCYFFALMSLLYFDACVPMPPHQKEQKRSELFEGVPESA